MLAREHGIAYPPARGQGLVEGGGETTGGLYQRAMAHSHYRGHAHPQQFGGDHFGDLLGLGALTGLQEYQGDVVVPQQRA